MAKRRIQASKVERAVMRYHGGKWLLAQWLVEHFPPHRIYVEPFGGAASVLMQKARSYGEVYNDLDSEIVNVFRVLRDTTHAKEIERVIRLTPYARDEFDLAYQPTDDPVELARRTLTRAFMGFGSASATKGHRTGWRANVKKSGTTPAIDWQRYPDHIAQFTARLQGVTIENRDAHHVITAHDAPDTLMYVDPPYPFATRYQNAKWRACYKHELTDDMHRDLAATLRAVKGMVVVSGYRCDLYDVLYSDWASYERATFADNAEARTEVVWLNARAVKGLSQQSLF